MSRKFVVCVLSVRREDVEGWGGLWEGGAFGGCLARDPAAEDVGLCVREIG